jgi:hypothetical protein
MTRAIAYGALIAGAFLMSACAIVPPDGTVEIEPAYAYPEVYPYKYYGEIGEPHYFYEEPMTNNLFFSQRYRDEWGFHHHRW